MINFPDAPVLNQIHSAAGIAWKWDGSKWIAWSGPLPGDVTHVTAGTGLVGGGGPDSGGNVTLALEIPVTIPHGGTSATTAGQALANLGGFPTTGGTITGSVVINGYLNVGNDLGVGGNIYTGNTVQGGYLYSTGNLQVNGNSQVNGNGHFNGDITADGNCYIVGFISTPNHLTAGHGFCLSGANFNFDYTVAMQYADHTQWVSGLGVYAQFFTPYSDDELKRNIEPVERDALAAIKPIQFYSYDSPRTNPGGEEIIDERSHVSVGFLAQQVRESLADAVVETNQPTIFHKDHDMVNGVVGCGFETRPVLAIDIMTMLAYSLRAIQQLADRVEELEGRS